MAVSTTKTLIKRYLELIRNDLGRLFYLLLEAPLLAGLLCLVAETDTFANYGEAKTLLFCLACTSIWLGLFISIQEICKERVIVKRELQSRKYNASQYVVSKVIVISIMCLIRSLLLILIFTYVIGKPESGIIFKNSVFELYITTFLTSLSAAMLGLFVSSVSRKTETAMLFAPVLLILQLLFSGMLFKLSGANKILSYFTMSKWSMEGYGSIADLNALQSKLQSLSPAMVQQAEDAYLRNINHLISTWGVFLLMFVLLFFMSIFAVRNIINDER